VQVAQLGVRQQGQNVIVYVLWGYGKHLDQDIWISAEARNEIESLSPAD